MPTPRSQIVVPGVPGAFHCVSRCVRRAYLCGFDERDKRSYEHRREWVENRVLELAGIFAVSVLGYAVMHNHVHLVLTVAPDVAADWAAEEVADRWLRLYPSADPEASVLRRSNILGDAERVAVYRARLADLSWFMRCLNEPIARRANAEDKVTGRFWEGRFKCQVLLDESAILAAMTYVDLNPIRARIAKSVPGSKHTSVARRSREIRTGAIPPGAMLKPLAGPASPLVPCLRVADYIELVDYTGREFRTGKRGRIAADEPSALRRLDVDGSRWTRQVRGIGSGYWRVVGTVDDLLAKARQIGQRWVFGIGFARALAR